MGNKALSLMWRPFRNFNLEDRAHKVISRSKPIAAPKHKSDQLDYERILKDHPEILEENLKKHDLLDKNLKQVYVESNDRILEPPPNPERPLPLNRSQVQAFEYGIKESENVPSGRVSLGDALKFITAHQEDSKINSAQIISKEYEIPEETTKNILKYFRVFEVYIPNERRVPAQFAGPSVPRIKVIPRVRKQLAAGKSGD